MVIGNSHEELNEQLTIRLVNLNQQDVDDPIVDLEVDFDNVRLDASPLADADFDSDGDVDGDDLLVWQAAYVLNDSADADGNGVSNGADFLAWQRQYTGESSPMVGTEAVPEPTSKLIGIGLLMGFSGRAFAITRQNSAGSFLV